MDLTSALILAVVTLTSLALAFSMFLIKTRESQHLLELNADLVEDFVESQKIQVEQLETIQTLRQELANAHRCIELVVNEREKPCSQEQSSYS